MAVVDVQTLQPVEQVGIKEDFMNEISRVAAEDCPFVMMIGTKGRAKQGEISWLTEDLRAPDAQNKHVPGDRAAFTATNQPAVLKNQTQIFHQAGSVSRSSQQYDTYGRENDYDRIVTLAMLELHRDIEVRLIGNYRSLRHSGATPAEAAGILAFTPNANLNVGATGAAGGYNTGTGLVSAVTPGTTRPLTEALLSTTMQALFTAHGRSVAREAYMGVALKAKANAFVGVATNRIDVKSNMQATVIQGVDIIDTGWGKLTLVPHAYALANEFLICNKEYASVAPVEMYNVKKLGRVGDADEFLIVSECTLRNINPKAHGAIVAVN